MKTKQIFLSTLFVLISCVCVAEGGIPVPAPPVPPGTPIDGGILVGIVVALGYGAKKMLFQKNVK